MGSGIACIVAAMLATVLFFEGTGHAASKSGEISSLTEIVFYGVRSAGELRTEKAPVRGNACVQRYLDAIPPGSSILEGNFPSDPESAALARRTNLAEQMTAILGENARKEANAFAFSVPLMMEWEGMSSGPVDEANFAGRWLAERPDSKIAPFLHLFMAHRLRAGYEAARAGQEKERLSLLARRYHESLGKARSSGNPLISCIADLLEAQSHVYLEG